MAVGITHEEIAARITHWINHNTEAFLVLAHGDDSWIYIRATEEVITSDYRRFDTSQTRPLGKHTNRALEAAGCVQGDALNHFALAYTLPLQVKTESGIVNVTRSEGGSFCTGSSLTTINNTYVNLTAIYDVLMEFTSQGQPVTVDEFEHHMLERGFSAKVNYRPSVEGSEFLKRTFVKATLRGQPCYASIPSLAQFVKMGKSGRNPTELYAGGFERAAKSFLCSQAMSLGVFRCPLTAPAYAKWRSFGMSERTGPAAAYEGEWWREVETVTNDQPYPGMRGALGEVQITYEDAVRAHSIRYSVTTQAIDRLGEQLAEYAGSPHAFALLLDPVWADVTFVEYG